MPKIEDVRFIVPIKDGDHALYLADSTIVIIHPIDGHIHGVARLPSNEAVSAFRSDATDSL